MSSPIYDVPVHAITGEPTSLGAYRGKVLLVVNVASKCGLTKQYDALEKLYARFKDQGLAVLGFPANDFGAQEPGTNDEIATFCQTSFSVDFPMFSKIAVTGPDTHPLYSALIAAQPKASGETRDGVPREAGWISGQKWFSADESRAGNPVELREVPDRPHRQGDCALLAGGSAGRSGDRRCHPGHARELNREGAAPASLSGRETGLRRVGR